MNERKPLLKITVKLEGEIYDRVYGLKDLQHVVDLFNEINGNCMSVKIIEVQGEQEHST